MITSYRFYRIAVTGEYIEDDEDDLDKDSGVFEMMMYCQHGRTNSSFATKFYSSHSR